MTDCVPPISPAHDAGTRCRTMAGTETSENTAASWSDPADLLNARYLVRSPLRGDSLPRCSDCSASEVPAGVSRMAQCCLNAASARRAGKSTGLIMK